MGDSCGGLLDLGGKHTVLDIIYACLALRSNVWLF